MYEVTGKANKKEDGELHEEELKVLQERLLGLPQKGG
jgi:hypothetical protein